MSWRHANGVFCPMPSKLYSLVFENGDVKKLLGAEIEMAGGQAAFSRKHRVSRVTLNKIVQRKRTLTKKLIKSLKLRLVYIRE
jgi:hypothetical protein